MKKLLLTLSALVLCFYTGMAQHIPNSSFESWGSFSYEEPPTTPWITSNVMSVFDLRQVTVTRVAGYNSSSAVRLETAMNGTDTIPASISNELDGLFDSTGGRPYFGDLPLSVSGFIRHDLLNNDTAFLMVIFKKNGIVVGSDLVNLAQSSSQLSFTQFNAPVNVSATPDTVLILFMINNLMSGGAWPTPGSWLELDSLTFETANGPVPVEEGGFENWSTYYIDEPTDWKNGALFMSGYPGQVTQTQDYHTGGYAASINTIEEYIFSEVAEGELSLIVPVNTVTSDSTDSLTFYYKYNTPAPGMDKGMISVTGLTADSLNLYPPQLHELDTASNFTKKTVSIDGLPANTAYLLITFHSSSPFGTATEGSNLIIDDVSITRTSLGIKDTKKSSLKIYPNPAQDVVYIEQANGFDYRVVDMAGKTFLHGTIEGGQINVKQLIPGNYLLQIQDRNGNSQTSLIEKQ